MMIVNQSKPPTLLKEQHSAQPAKSPLVCYLGELVGSSLTASSAQKPAFAIVMDNARIHPKHACDHLACKYWTSVVPRVSSCPNLLCCAPLPTGAVFSARMPRVASAGSLSSRWDPNVITSSSDSLKVDGAARKPQRRSAMEDDSMSFEGDGNDNGANNDDFGEFCVFIDAREDTNGGSGGTGSTSSLLSSSLEWTTPTMIATATTSSA